MIQRILEEGEKEVTRDEEGIQEIVTITEEMRRGIEIVEAGPDLHHREETGIRGIRDQEVRICRMLNEVEVESGEEDQILTATKMKRRRSVEREERVDIGGGKSEKKENDINIVLARTLEAVIQRNVITTITTITTTTTIRRTRMKL